jgi:hypothetical protein
MAKLDRDKPFVEVVGKTQVRFRQGGKEFDFYGKEITPKKSKGGDPKSAVSAKVHAKSRKPESKE